MTDVQQLRIEGIYEQRQPGNFMLRVKVPAGVLTSDQAHIVCTIAERFNTGGIHITTRTSIEFHWLQRADLDEARHMLASAGLTSRGACGGAVRGVVCSTPFSDSFPALQTLASRLHRHFTNNERFEGLPKKFKIGVDGDVKEGRHLIQDIGLVGTEVGGYDVWTAGGLGREPLPGFLLEPAVPEERLIPLIEAVIRVYKQHTPAGKRLKHLVREIGRDAFRQLVQKQLQCQAPLTSVQRRDDLPHAMPPAGAPSLRLQVSVFAGELTSATLRSLADIATAYAAGVMILTCDQNVAFHLTEAADAARASSSLAKAGFRGTCRSERVTFRICPGNHECRLGLAPTRDVAAEILSAMSESGEAMSWAIAGCPNSCSQPQLADVGIVAAKLLKEENGDRTARFDVYRRNGNDSLGILVRSGLSLAKLIEATAELSKEYSQT